MPDFLFYPLLFALGGLLFVNFEILIRGNSYKGTFSAGGIYLWFVYSVFIKTSLPHIIKLFVAVGTAVTLYLFSREPDSDIQGSGYKELSPIENEKLDSADDETESVGLFSMFFGAVFSVSEFLVYYLCIIIEERVSKKKEQKKEKKL